MSLFKEWIVVHSKAEKAMKYMDKLRSAKRASRWDTEALGAHLLSASHCGKSHIVNKMYFSHHILPELRRSGEFPESVPDDQVKRLQKKYLYVKVPPKATLGDFGTKLLVALDDGTPQIKGENVLDRIRRAEQVMQSAGTELLVLDNFDQLTKKADAESQKQATDIQDTVKSMMEHGLPIVFTGLYYARNAILKNMQLKNRAKSLDIMPLRLDRDRDEFRKFLVGLELLMLETGILDEESGLAEDYALLRLYYASQGRLGVLSNIVRDAAILASERKSSRIEVPDLVQSIDEYALDIEMCLYNPFLKLNDEEIERDCKVRVAVDEKGFGDKWMKYFDAAK